MFWMKNEMKWLGVRKKKVEEGEGICEEKGVLLKKIEDLGDNLKALQAKVRWINDKVNQCLFVHFSSIQLHL